MSSRPGARSACESARAQIVASCARRRECIVEGESGSTKSRSKPKGGISEEFAALKDTRWHWNE